ncbi:hypothetical protein [Paenibacillus ferrarius]|nr:hypothetical protein [Paenibacillus ferrarius]
MPEKSLKGWTHPPGMEIIGVNTVAEALRAALGSFVVIQPASLQEEKDE